MGLGHALLHPERLRRATRPSATGDAMGATVDVAFGLAGMTDQGPAAAAWASGAAGRAGSFGEAVLARLRQGPLGGLLGQGLPDVFGSPAALGARLEGLIEALASPDPDALRRRVLEAVDALLDTLPDWRPPQLAAALQAELDAALGLLEGPLAGGRRDAAAHRSFRTAAEIRRRLRRLKDPIPPRLAGMDLKALLRARVAAWLGTLDIAALRGLGLQLAALRDEFGRLFGALGRVSVSVEVRVDGPQPMSEPRPGLDDEAKPTPFPPGHPLWWADLSTGVFAVFNLFWEMVRTRNFRPGWRLLDGGASVLLLVWQGVRVFMRAGAPDMVNGLGEFGRWAFTDQGDFALSLGLRLLASLCDASQGWSNWGASALVRGLKHVTAVTQPRAIYQTWRSIWYHGLWRDRRGTEHDFQRAIWLTWGPMWGLGSLFGLFPDWSEFRLEGHGSGVHPAMLVALVISLFWAIIAPFALHDGAKLADDHRTRIFMSVLAALLMVPVFILVSDVESDDATTAWVAAILSAVGIGLALLFSWIPQTEVTGSHLLIGLAGLVVASALPFALWWTYIDDGRDKPGDFEGLDPGSSPYRLPYTAGESWMCSQGTHGIFSHHTLNNTRNHFAYDFNEAEHTRLRAARDGLVTRVSEGNPNRGPVGNSLVVLHTGWQAGHDPGTDEERVLTSASYVHLTEGGALPGLGQRVAQGEDIARLDSTGRSAQQHIHLGVTLAQDAARGEAGHPFLFQDSHAQTRRNYPLLTWIKGKGHIPGKPVAYAFYVSDNAPVPAGDAAPRALTLPEGVAPEARHAHALHIPAEAFPSGNPEVELFADPVEGHTHRVTLPRAALEAMRGAGRPDLAGVVVHPAPDGHAHGATMPAPPAGEIWALGVAGNLEIRALGLVTPPEASLTATLPGPYRLLGGQAVLRVNGRATEAWMFGAHRPSVRAAVTAERGLAPAEPIQLTSAAGLAPAADLRGAAPATVAALNATLGAAGTQLALVAEPVLVIETMRRGRLAGLRLLEDAQGALPALGPAESAGAGLLEDLDNLPVTQLAAHVEGVLRQGWPAPPGPVGQAFGPGWPSLDLAGSAPRSFAVLSQAAVGATAGALASPHPLPLQPGPVGVRGGWTAPLLAAPAALDLPLDVPAMRGAARSATPLIVTLSGLAQEVRFAPADTDAAAVARRIMLAAVGVRTRVLAPDRVRVMTVAGGAEISLALAKADWSAAPVTGRSAGPLAGGTSVRDTGAVPPAALRGAVTEAVAAATLPYDPAMLDPRADIEAGRLRLRVATGQSIRVEAEAEPLLGTAPAEETWLSDALPERVSLAGCGWLDVRAAGRLVRVPLTGEPARIELGPLPRLPAAGARLRLEVDGVVREVTFSGTEGSLDAVAAHIAASMPRITLRLAHRISADGTLHGAASAAPSLRESEGLNLLGFVQARDRLSDTAEGPLPDGLAGLTHAPDVWREAGPRFEGLSVAPDGPPTLTPPAGTTLTVAVAGSADPLRLGSGPGPSLAPDAGVTFPFRLPRGATTWQFSLEDGHGATLARTRAQLAASPAALRARSVPVPRAGALPLKVRVAGPDGARPEVTLDMAGVGDAVAAALRLSTCPGVVAFAATQDSALVLHVETQGRGHGWELTLAGRDALLAMGFGAPLPWEDRLAAKGGGPVADGAAVTDNEARDMLRRAALSAVATPRDPPAPYLLAYTNPSASPATLRLEPGAPGAPPVRISPETQPFPGLNLAVETPTGVEIIAPENPPPLRPVGAVLRLTAGPWRVSRALTGSPAVLRGPDPVPRDGTPEATAQLQHCAAHGFTLSVDDVAKTVPPTGTALTSMEELVAHIARAVQPGWAGLRPDPGGGPERFLEWRSARRGTGARLRLAWPTASPPPGLLGFSAEAAAAGSGSVPDAEALTLAQLHDALVNPEHDQPQNLLRATAEAARPGTVLVSPVGASRVVGVAGLPPGLVEAAEGEAWRLTLGLALPMADARIEIRVARGPGQDATVTIPIWGTPARLDPLTLPATADLPALAGRSLAFEIGTETVVVTLDSEPSALTSGAALAAEIARRSGWRLRAWTEGGTLRIETLRQGLAARLALTGGSALTGSPAISLAGGMPGVASQGGGSVPDLDAVRPQDLAAAIEAGWQRQEDPGDGAQFLFHPVNRQGYSPQGPAGQGWRIRSARRGVAGRLEFLQAPVGLDDLALDTSVARGAAVRAAVILRLPAETVAPNGALVLRLDDNTGPGLPMARDVTLGFDGTPLDAPGLAVRLDAALRAAGAGAAAAWPEERIVVIESATPGLAGRVTLPAPGPRGAADALLGGVTQVLDARGWPGGGMTDSHAPMRRGWRAVRSRAAGDVEYRFAAAGRETPAIPITAGSTAEAAALAINLGFDATAAGGGARMGLAAAVGDVLFVEALVEGLVLRVDGELPLATGQTPELPPDPGFDLRRTDLLRTAFLARAATDAGDFGAAALRLGWLRHAMDLDADGQPIPAATLRLPGGRWRVAVRPDAARAEAEGAEAAALRQAVAMAPAFTATSPLMLRYWPVFAGALPLGGGQDGPDGPWMTDILLPP